MSTIRYSAFYSFIQQIASSGPGAWFFARTLHHFDRACLSLTGNRTSLTAILSGLPVVFVTTVGAKSGATRRIPLIAIPDERETNVFALIASNWGQQHNPAWYYNLKAHPQVTCAIARRKAAYVAHEASGEEYARFWQRAGETYIGYPLYKERAGERHIPIMVMCPAREAVNAVL